jgi:hypothetical protein
MSAESALFLLFGRSSLTRHVRHYYYFSLSYNLSVIDVLDACCVLRDNKILSNYTFGGL